MGIKNMMNSLSVWTISQSLLCEMCGWKWGIFRCYLGVQKKSVELLNKIILNNNNKNK